MSKKSKKPAYSSGAVSINGNNLASVSKVGDTISSNYNMSDTEQRIYNSIQDNIATTLNNLYNISDPQREEWQNQLNAMKDVGLQNLNDIYTPIQNNLKNDIASRFGNLDNSIFLDKLGAITNSKSKAIADLANNLMLAQNDLYNQEIQNRMNMLNLLEGLNNNMNNNILNYLGLANQNSNSGNQYSSYGSSTPIKQNNLSSKYLNSSLGAYGVMTGNPGLIALAAANSFI